MDLLSRDTFVDREYSGILNPETMIYTCTTAGLYYLRVDIYSSIPTPYSLDIQINGILKDVHYDTVFSYSSGKAVQQFYTQNACKVKITYTGKICPLYLFAPNDNVMSGIPYDSSLTSENPQIMFVNLNSSGKWNLVVNHGITSGATLESFNVVIKTYT